MFRPVLCVVVVLCVCVLPVCVGLLCVCVCCCCLSCVSVHVECVCVCVCVCVCSRMCVHAVCVVVCAVFVFCVVFATVSVEELHRLKVMNKGIGVMLFSTLKKNMANIQRKHDRVVLDLLSNYKWVRSTIEDDAASAVDTLKTDRGIA